MNTQKNHAMRFLSAVLAVLMVLSALALAGCAETTDPKTDPTPTATPTNGPTATPTEEAEEKIVYKADVPEGTNYGGEEFTVYAYPEDVFVWKDYDWQHEDGLTGDRISDAVLTRSQQVEEELGITIVVDNGQSYGDPSDFTKTLASGDDVYDIGNVTMLNHVSMLQNGYIQEIKSYSDTLNLEAAWWDQNLLKDLTVSDKVFCLLGDIGTMYKRCIACIIFNKKLVKDNEMTSPYTMIENKTWTMEALFEMAETVHNDVNGDDKYDENDLYGLICFSDIMPAMMIGADVQFATKNDDDIPEMTLYCDRALDALDILSIYVYDDEMTYFTGRHGTDESTMWTMFMNNQALYYYGELHSAEDMRQMESDFGILPMPLLDEDQEEYRHTVNPNVAAVYVIPLTNTDSDSTGYILDSLGAASKNILTPAYYDLNLQGVVSRDDESTISLDTIIATMSYDIGYLYIANTGSMLRGLLDSKSTDLSSKYESALSSMESTIEKLVDAIDTKYNN